MKTLLYIIVDVSGSMNEMGKIFLQRNLCRYISQLKFIDPITYLNVDIHFFQWAEEISEIIIQEDGDIPALTPGGGADLTSLFSFFKALNHKSILRVLVLSDGNFETSDILNFRKQCTSLPNLLLRTVAVGADANLSSLESISSNDSVYLAENISAAINAIIEGKDECLAAPKTISQILLKQSAEPEEDWDV
jgi:hypothetical protein